MTPPRLSFCTVTADPVATGFTLELLRPVVDETVVAVDSRHTEHLDALGDVDRLVVIDFNPPLERVLPWVQAQCTGRWVLRLDADEIPGRALLDSLGDLTSVDDVTHYWITRRWLYESADTYLVDSPWSPDFQLRLAQNLPAVNASPTRLHAPPLVAGAHRYIEHPIYHRDLLNTTFEARSRKALAYERYRPGHRSGGVAINAAFYLPELRPHADVAPVPEEDRPLVGAWTRDGAGGDGVERVAEPTGDATTPSVTPSEVDRLWPGRSFADTAYRATVEPFGRVPTLRSSLAETLFVRVTNRGTETWPAGSQSLPEIRVGTRFHARDGRVVGEDARTAFPAPIAPGRSAIVPVNVHAPSEPGEYSLEVDVVHEHVRWFGVPCTIDVSVERHRRVMIVAGYSPFRHVGDDAIVGAHLQRLALTAPDVQPVLLAPHPELISHRFGHTGAPSIHHALYDGIDVTADRDVLFDRVMARLGELLWEATRFRSGKPSADPLRRAFFTLVSECELAVFASGGALASRFEIAEFWPQMATALVAEALGTRVVFSGVTVGPFDGPGDRALAARGFDAADLIVVRDHHHSRRLLTELGVADEKIVEEGDPASALGECPDTETDHALTNVGLPPGEPFVAVSVRAGALGGVVDALVALLDHASSKYGLAVLFVPHCTTGPDDDLVPMAKIRDQLSSSTRVHVLSPLPPDDVVMGVIERATIAVGSRYHLAVFAAAAGVPAIGIAEDDHTAQKLRGAAEFGNGYVTVVPAECTGSRLIELADEILSDDSDARPAMGPSALTALSGLNSPF